MYVTFFIDGKNKQVESQMQTNQAIDGADGIIIKIMLESLIGGNTACKDMCMDTRFSS